ncbi:hypothetical protein GGI12_002489 [Dipsacomyces acuminosporus]|nr:hypothetical protein GGI12_002489 [Dipsacomyces acuminosporus]
MRVLLARRLVRAPRPVLDAKPRSAVFYTTFPLDKPSWSVGHLLEKPTQRPRSMEQEHLGVADIQRLYNLAGLKMPDQEEEPEEFTQLSREVNQLHDFLSHIHEVSSSSDLKSIEPLVRIAEQVEFTAEAPDGGLQFTQKETSQLGREILRIAEKRSGEFLMVED